MREYVLGGPPRFQHQKRGLRKIIETGGVAALLFDPGTGKTATALDYAGLLALKAPSGEARVLVVCPLAATDTWVKQAEVYVSPQVNVWAEVLGGSIRQRGEALASRGGSPFVNRKPPASGRRASAPGRALHHGLSDVRCARPSSDYAGPSVNPRLGPDSLPAPRLVIEVINIDTLASRMQPKGQSITLADFMVEAIRRYSPDLVVVDESHRIKSVMGNASRLLARVSKFVPRRIILTGTVMPHSPMDVFGQWRFLEPYAFGELDANGIRKQATAGAFRNRFAIMGGFMGREVVGYRNLDDMHTIMAKNAIVVRKADALDLPPTMDVEVPVELSASERKAYADMKSSLAASLLNGEQATVPNRLTQMLRLRQITSGYLQADSGTMHTIGQSKAKTIKSLVQDTLAGETRIVIFCFFTAELHHLAQILRAPDTEVMVISGGTPSEDRMAMRQRFGSDDPARMVMVAQIRTMSLAVNELVTANHAIFASLSQQRDDLIQARDRLNRIGQTRPVTFWYALAPGTVDTVIMDSHRKRTNLEDAMLKHIAEPG